MDINHKIIVAIDVMGGDNAPHAPIYGASEAAIRCPNLFFIFFGDEAIIKPIIEKIPKLNDKYQIHHTNEVISNDEKPSNALRIGKNSSMALAIGAVANGSADAVVSAGNTGALMALAMFGLRKIEGVARPALCASFPTMRGQSCLLDLGGNIECDSQNLHQFSIMGAEFARIIFGLPNPVIGLLNVGSESGKGPKVIQETAKILSEDKSLKYYGYVEGDDIAKGIADVYVADGFTGNLILKTAEGTAKLIGHFLKSSLSATTFGKIGYLFARRNLKKFKNFTDPRKYNGAVFLGLNGIAIKSHGGTDELGYATAVELAFNLVSQKFIQKITENIQSQASHGNE